jgi:predicted negative regulator of RcsB-dependent stress response
MIYICVSKIWIMIEQLSFEDLKHKFNNNKSFKFGTYLVVGLLAIVLVYFLYRQFIWGPANEKSNDGWWVALNYVTKDSTDQAIRILEPFVKNNDGKTGGEIAQYLLATQYMEKGKYTAAIKQLEDVDLQDTYVATLSIGLQGDCYSQMKKYKDALSFYTQAAEREDNDFTTPMYLFKAGLVCEKLKQKEDAAAHYQRIKDDYPNYPSAQTIDRYIARCSTK